jgi:hypothetical protein
MNRRPIILGSIAAGALLFALACVLWFTRPAVPTIRFVEHKGGGTEHGAAIFRITNNSRGEFFYYGTEPSSPHFSYRVSTPVGWQRESYGWCGLGTRIYSVAPNSTMDIQVSGYFGDSPSRAVGVQFYRGNPMAPLSGLKLYIARSAEIIRRLIDPDGPEPVWSDVVPPLPFPDESPANPVLPSGP